MMMIMMIIKIIIIIIILRQFVRRCNVLKVTTRYSYVFLQHQQTQQLLLLIAVGKTDMSEAGS